jgi:hypothetical protein
MTKSQKTNTGVLYAEDFKEMTLLKMMASAAMSTTAWRKTGVVLTRRSQIRMKRSTGRRKVSKVVVFVLCAVPNVCFRQKRVGEIKG